MECKICGNKKDNFFIYPKEMMFGFKDKFQYLLCNKCETLSLINIPSNMSKYYPENYYSLKKENKRNFLNILKEKLKEKRDLYGISRKDFIGKILFKISPRQDYYFFFKNIQKNKKILDVGCGNGLLLKRLNKLNYFNLFGIDPFIKETKLDKGIQLIKKDILKMQDKFDVIMFHHSFEHIANPLETLKKTEELLNENGICIIRIPLIPDFCFDRYKENWFQLDAPRHLFLHSQKGMELLAKKSKLKIKKIIFDSTYEQFLSSELYKKEIPLIKQNYKRYFTNAQIKKAKNLAKELNEGGKGDQAIIILEKN